MHHKCTRRGVRKLGGWAGAALMESGVNDDDAAQAELGSQQSLSTSPSDKWTNIYIEARLFCIARVWSAPVKSNAERVCIYVACDSASDKIVKPFILIFAPENKH
jgi:hypothetical protein